MAVTPREIPLTRDEVYSWVAGWKRSKKDKSLDEWIRVKVDNLKLEDRMVVTEGHDSLPSEVDLADFILMDISSYSNLPENYAPDS